METLCRLCGKVNINLINVLDGSNENLKSEIYTLLRIEIHPSDSLPTQVCTLCVAAVREATTFINGCHHVQKMLKEKYEAVNKDPKGTKPVSKVSSSMIQIPFEMERARKNASSEEHSSILDADHSVFVEEPRKLTFVDPDDPDELISDVTSDPLVSEPSTSNNINFNQIIESNSGVLPNELPAPPRYETSDVPYSFDDSMNNEELPYIKSEAIEMDDCFAPDPLEMESDETYVPNSENIQQDAEANENAVSTLNSVLPESTQNVLSVMPIRMDGEGCAETDQNYSFDSTYFPTQRVNAQDIGEEIYDKSTKTLLSVTLTRMSESECPLKSDPELVSTTDDELHQSNTHSTLNKMVEEKFTPPSTCPPRVNPKHNLERTLMSVLTSQKVSPALEVPISKKLEGVGKGKQLINKNAWSNYFTTHSFRRQPNNSMPGAAINNVVPERFKTPVSTADHKDGGASSETDPQKLFDYCMQITKQLNLKKYKHVERPRVDRHSSEQSIKSDKSQSRSKNECSTSSTDPTAEDGDSKNSLVSIKSRTFLECGTCAKKFLSKSLYDDHLNLHTGYRPFQCDLCSRTYRRRSDLNVHVRIVHARGEFKCSLCDYVASYEGRLKVHLKTSHEKPFICSICNYRCGAKKRMAEHILNKHQNIEGERVEVCELCGGSFKGKLSLRAHQRIVHFPEPQVCSACGKQCPNQTVYKNHLTECGKEKIRYKCDLCGQTYSKKAVLKEHMNKHLNIKPYECKVCNKQFFLRVRLLTHMAVHRAPTFQCEVCCKSFNRKDNMKSHMKKHFEKAAS